MVASAARVKTGTETLHQPPFFASESLKQINVCFLFPVCLVGNRWDILPDGDFIIGRETV
jgi:hypothetical protein